MTSEGGDSTSSYERFARSRTAARVAGTAASWGVVLPLVARRLPANLPALWCPRSPLRALLLGATGGAAEDGHTRVAFGAARRTGAATVETELWTVRSLVPALCFFASPLLAWKCLDGELKGTSLALAELEGRPLQLWPVFAVLDVSRPSAVLGGPRYRTLRPSGGLLDWWTHLLRCRLLLDGFYVVPRNPRNDPWRVV